MIFVKVKKNEAEETRRRLVELGVLSRDYLVERDKGYVYFPVASRIEGFEIVERDGKRIQRPRSLKEALKGILTDEEIDQLITSFDIIGDIAIIQIPDSLSKKEKEIARALMEVHKNVRVVCRKLGPRQGVFRLSPLKVIAGENRYTTIYRENGVRMKVDVLRAYFSPRLATERKRIADLVKDGEVIAALFAGVGPFPLVIAKYKNVDIYAVEINPYAYELMVENIRMNRLKGRIHPILGDVREVLDKIPPSDRVLMPLPLGADKFLDCAFKIVKPGGYIHFYHFSPEGDLYDSLKKTVTEVAEKFGRRVEFIGERVVRPYKPRVLQVVLDILVH